MARVRSTTYGSAMPSFVRSFFPLETSAKRTVTRAGAEGKAQRQNVRAVRGVPVGSGPVPSARASAQTAMNARPRGGASSPASRCSMHGWQHVRITLQVSAEAAPPQEKRMKSRETGAENALLSNMSKASKRANCHQTSHHEDHA